MAVSYADEALFYRLADEKDDHALIPHLQGADEPVNPMISCGIDGGGSKQGGRNAKDYLPWCDGIRGVASQIVFTFPCSIVLFSEMWTWQFIGRIA
ncbi:hypothetical protein AeRB84_012492 [Aphanomyces euteiches]|nr:hypothetical protein AeRB84_012492 [Aphanomyces euteiches]